MPELQTQCCVVGGGPAGLMLGLLLARSGVDVVVLEKHADFLRDFRGDTIHPSTIDLLRELGLAQALLALPHTRIETLDIVVSGNRIRPIDFRKLRHGSRFLALMPQWDFLNFIAAEASRYPGFRLILEAEVRGILRERGQVAGVTAMTPDGPLEVGIGVSPDPASSRGQVTGPQPSGRRPVCSRASSASPSTCSGSICRGSACRSRPPSPTWTVIRWSSRFRGKTITKRA